MEPEKPQPTQENQSSPYTSNTQDINVSQTSPTESTSVSSGAGEATQEESKVTLTKSGFSPQTVTVQIGTKVTWTNESGTTATVNSADHPTHLKYPPLNLGSFASGESLSLVFDKAGTYGYHNHLNASQTGTVVVE